MGRWKAQLAIGAVFAAAAILLLGAGFLARLEEQVEARFRGRLFAVPSRVYSAPLVLYPGLELERVRLFDRLQRLNYHPASAAEARADPLGAREAGIGPGEYRARDSGIEIGRRRFRYPHQADPGGAVRIELDSRGGIERILDPRGAELETIELEPELVAELHGPNRQDRRLVRLDETPRHLVEAVLAIEDQRFYQHRGVDPRRIVGALLANLRAGRVVQGGSTLTQQLVKNFYLTRERSLWRKLREALMALLLERNHPKPELLEAYLNEVYMGQRGSVAVHGMGEAAHYYFAKQVEDLAPHESALLAAMIKGPNLYSPHVDPIAAQERRDLVLALLLEQGRISELEYEAAVASPLGVKRFFLDDNPAPHFVELLRQELREVYGEEILESEGLAIHTTLDPSLQRSANRAVRDGIARLEERLPTLRREEPPLEAALVAVAPRTGEILALVGGRDYARSQFNRATQARRQPGSVFKPVVALAALRRGPDSVPRFTLASKLQDEPLSVPSGGIEWTPVNYDGEFRGEVTLRQAIEQSLNVPVARLGLQVGPERIIQTARELGIESALDPVPSLALGAFEVTLLEMTRAYAVLAADGVLPTLRGYVDVVDAEGEVLDRKAIHFDRKFDPEETYLVTSALRGAVDRGTGQSLRRLGFTGPVAGKTGTSNDFRDAWFIGYTPDLLVGVWVGFDDGASLGVPGSVAALPIFADFAIDALGPEGRAPFLEPAGLERVSIDPGTDRRAGRGEPELFLAGSAPEEGRESRPEAPVDRFFGWLRDRL
jgi:penicillin-binding protein 1B